MTVENSTLDGVRTAAHNRAGVIGRRVALAVLTVVVLVAATGMLGVHTSTARATGPGVDLTVEYPRVARAGLDIEWNLRLHHDGGFGGKDIVVAISANYFDIFEFQGMHPEPSDETSDGKFVYLTFSPPKGDTFTTALDTYVQPAAQLGRTAVTAVRMDGVTVAQVKYRTWVVP